MLLTGWLVGVRTLFSRQRMTRRSKRRVEWTPIVLEPRTSPSDSVTIFAMLGLELPSHIEVEGAGPSDPDRPVSDGRHSDIDDEDEDAFGLPR